MDSIPQKRCTKCKEFKNATLEYFGKHSLTKDGLRSRCRVCTNADTEAWRKNNPESYKDSNRKSCRKRYYADLDSNREKHRVYEREHSDQRKVRYERWKKNNLGRYKEWYAQYAETNREKINAANRKSAKKNRSSRRQNVQRYRSRRRALPATLSRSEWESILADYGYACAYCGKEWFDCKLTQDHVIPVTQGGGYTADNIVPACGSCNSKKNNRTPDQAGMPLRAKCHRR